jgi:hypothetical protein
MTRKLRTKRTAVLALLAVLAMAAGAAAYWTATGGGSATATTGTAGAGDIVVNDAAPVGPNLVPGGLTQVLSGTVENTTTDGTTLAISQLVATIAAPTNTAGACTSTDYQFAASAGWTLTDSDVANGKVNDVATHAYDPTTTNLGSGATAAFGGLNLKMVNKPSVNQNGCKGATANVTYAAS